MKVVRMSKETYAVISLSISVLIQLIFSHRRIVDPCISLGLITTLKRFSLLFKNQIFITFILCDIGS